jgi:hypothetical protein
MGSVVILLCIPALLVAIRPYPRHRMIRERRSCHPTLSIVVTMNGNLRYPVCSESLR